MKSNSVYREYRKQDDRLTLELYRETDEQATVFGTTLIWSGPLQPIDRTPERLTNWHREDSNDVWGVNLDDLDRFATQTALQTNPKHKPGADYLAFVHLTTREPPEVMENGSLYLTEIIEEWINILRIANIMPLDIWRRLLKMSFTRPKYHTANEQKIMLVINRITHFRDY